MSRVLTGDKLIESVRNRAMIPNDNSVFNDTNILSILNEELDVQLLDKLLSLHEEHLTVHVDIPRNSDGVYDIPYRAIGNKIRDCSLILGDGNVYELAQISLGELPDYTYDQSSYSSSGLDKFYVESNQIKILQPSRSYSSIRIYYYIRPNYITKLDQAGVISAITTTDTEVTFTFSSFPSKFTESLEYDIVGARTPNKIKAWDLSPISGEVNSSLKYIKFLKSDLEDTLSDIKVGDYLCKAEESPVPNIPTEMHPVLSQLASIHILESLGDSEALANAERRFEKMNNSVLQLVDDRVELAPKKIKPRHGTLNEARNGFSGRKRGW